MTWRVSAACLDENPELFFPIGNSDLAFQQTNKPKAVFRRCEVADTCLRWVMHSHQDDGVWGGLTADERDALKRRTARARRAGPEHPVFDGYTGPGMEIPLMVLGAVERRTAS